VGRQYHQQALQIYDSVIAIYIHNNISKKELARAYNNKGLLLNYMGTQQSASTDCYNRALQCFNQAIGIQKDYDMAYGNKGMMCANIGRTKEKAQRKAFYTEALACYDKAIALSQGPLCAVWLVNKAIVLSYIGDNEQAMRYCDTAIATYPNHSEAYKIKASVLEHQGKRHYKMALNYYNQALALDPNDDWCYFMKVGLLKKMGKKHDPEILMCLDKALELASDVHIDEIQAYKDKYFDK
jgi:tetratricopeptide (TPR) repeat protein